MMKQRVNFNACYLGKNYSISLYNWHVLNSIIQIQVLSEHTIEMFRVVYLCTNCVQLFIDVYFTYVLLLYQQ